MSVFVIHFGDQNTESQGCLSVSGEVVGPAVLSIISMSLCSLSRTMRVQHKEALG